MDKNDVQKWIPRYPFGKKRAALGNLRNFFGVIIGRPYMQWRMMTHANCVYVPNVCFYYDDGHGYGRNYEY